MKSKIAAFLDKKKSAWSEATLVSCRAFLNNYGLIVESGNPEALLTILQLKGRYTTQTYFIHAGNFYEFLFPTKENVFRKYRKDNRNAFKAAYQTKHLQVTYQEVKDLLTKQPDSEEKEACLYLLGTAQRARESGLYRRSSEAGTGAGDESVIVGKGGKQRLNLGADFGWAGNVSYYRVYNWLRQLSPGLTPHGLRKLALTRAGDNGANAADLCEIAGWSSISTAIRYLQPKRAAKLKAFLE